MTLDLLDLQHFAFFLSCFILYRPDGAASFLQHTPGCKIAYLSHDLDRESSCDDETVLVDRAR
jgi:hypothetical protein